MNSELKNLKFNKIKYYCKIKMIFILEAIPTNTAILQTICDPFKLSNKNDHRLSFKHYFF